jgi:hypothetical protein
MRQTLLCVLVCLGCDEEGDDTSPMDTDTPPGDSGEPTGELVIAGSYTDEWGVDHTIDETSWVQVSPYGSLSFDVLSFDNAARFVIAQNGSTNPYNPDLYSRFDWVDGLHGDLFYCQSAFDAATEEAAAATPRADDSDPENSGCGGFPWTNLVP